MTSPTLLRSTSRCQAPSQKLHVNSIAESRSRPSSTRRDVDYTVGQEPVEVLQGHSLVTETIGRDREERYFVATSTRDRGTDRHVSIHAGHEHQTWSRHDNLPGSVELVGAGSRIVLDRNLGLFRHHWGKTHRANATGPDARDPLGRRREGQLCPKYPSARQAPSRPRGRRGVGRIAQPHGTDLAATQ